MCARIFFPLFCPAWLFAYFLCTILFWLGEKERYAGQAVVHAIVSAMRGESCNADFQGVAEGKGETKKRTSLIKTSDCIKKISQIVWPIADARLGRGCLVLAARRRSR